MNTEDFTNAYKLSTLTISASELLLDPTNPRLITESSQDTHYTLAKVRSADTQHQLFDRICSRNDDVKLLINSITEMGFIDIKRMVVKKLAKGGPYLVINGNRRTAALRYLLTNKTDLRPEVRKSIERIDVTLFTYCRNTKYGEQEVIDALLQAIPIARAERPE